MNLLLIEIKNVSTLNLNTLRFHSKNHRQKSDQNLSQSKVVTILYVSAHVSASSNALDT